MDTRCEEMQPLLMQLAGGELPLADGPGVADHLAECPRCRTEWEALRSWLDGIAALPSVVPPEAARRRVRERVLAERDARVTRRALGRLGVAAAALLAAIGAWVTSGPGPVPGDSAGFRWNDPALPRFEEARWSNGIDSGLADVWFSMRDLREGKALHQEATPPEGIATTSESFHVGDDARALRWEWDQDDEDGGFDLRIRDLEKSIEDLSGEDQG